jgi:hypothetical protein
MRLIIAELESVNRVARSVPHDKIKIIVSDPAAVVISGDGCFRRFFEHSAKRSRPYGWGRVVSVRARR